MLRTSDFGIPTSFDVFVSAEVGPKDYLHGYLTSNADELDLDSALTLENEYNGEEFLVMTGVVKMESKTLEIVEGIQSAYTLFTTNSFWLAVDKYGYTYVSRGSLAPPSARYATKFSCSARRWWTLANEALEPGLHGGQVSGWEGVHLLEQAGVHLSVGVGGKWFLGIRIIRKDNSRSQDRESDVLKEKMAESQR